MPSTERIIAGAMSGTSADGVDVALVRITGRGTSMTAQLLHHHHHPLRDGRFRVVEADAVCFEVQVLI